MYTERDDSFYWKQKHDLGRDKSMVINIFLYVWRNKSKHGFYQRRSSLLCGSVETDESNFLQAKYNARALPFFYQWFKRVKNSLREFTYVCIRTDVRLLVQRLLIQRDCIHIGACFSSWLCKRKKPYINTHPKSQNNKIEEKRRKVGQKAL